MKKAKGIFKYIGLMFQKNPEPILFEWDKPVSVSIHSYFCKPFIAEWYDEEDNLILRLLVPPNQDNIKPNEPFVKLVETPIE